MITRALLLFGFVSVAGAAISPAAQLQTGRYTDDPTPFISFVHLRFDPAVPVSSAKFRIRPKEGSATRPVKASYASAYLEARGYWIIRLAS